MMKINIHVNLNSPKIFNSCLFCSTNCKLNNLSIESTKYIKQNIQINKFTSKVKIDIKFMNILAI